MTTAKNATRKPHADGSARNGVATPDGAYFLSLKLENVRCFGPAQTLDLSDRNCKPAPWTIILGVNGTGKTTILQSLAGFETRGYTAANGPSVGVPRFIFLSLDDRKSFARSPKISATVNVKIATVNNLQDPAAKIADHGCDLNCDSSKPGLMRFQPSPDMDRLWCCAYGAARRLGVVSLSDAGAEDSTATLFSDRADLRNAEEWLLQLDYAALKDFGPGENQRHRLNQVKQILLNIMPEGEIHDIRLTKAGGQSIAQAEFKTPYGWVPLRNLGYGYQSLITWVADLANRMVERRPEMPNPLEQPAVVLVDEIDLHLHPRWQRQLMEHLTKHFPNTQFIATSHSPLVAQDAAYANLVVLRREGDHVVIDKNLGEEIRGWRVDQILTSEVFGLESARPPQIEKMIGERKRLLTKTKLSNGEKQRLKELDAEVAKLPVDATAEEIRERQDLRKSIDLLLKTRQLSQ